MLVIDQSLNAKKTVGVVDAFHIFFIVNNGVALLKQLALYFDQILMPGLDGEFFSTELKNSQLYIELDWLKKNQIIATPVYKSQFTDFSEEFEEAEKNYSVFLFESIRIIFEITGNKFPFEGGAEIDAELIYSQLKQVARNYPHTNKLAQSEIFIDTLMTSFSYSSRFNSLYLREAQNVDSYPILFSFPPIKTEALSKDDVVQLILQNFPVPNDSTPWKQILDFRADPDSHSKFLALRNWTTEISKGNLTQIEIEQKLEYLIDQYKTHMKRHKMKINSGTLETVVVSSAEILGDLVSFKWGKAAQALFTLKNRKLQLLEGESKAPGNEIAYIVKAQERFK